MKTGIYNQYSFINVILILVINNFIILFILYDLEKIYIYNKIINNYQDYYKQNVNNIADIINISKQQDYQFIPDELSIDCSRGINIYYLHQEHAVPSYQAYVAQRTNIIVSPEILAYQQYFINKILTIYPNATNIKVTYDNIFFIINNMFYKYIINQHKLFSYKISTPIIDYIVGHYYIYLRTREANDLQDIINIMHIDNANRLTITKLATIPPANCFFLAANYLIFLYYESPPQIYKIINDHKLAIQNLKITKTSTLCTHNQEPFTNTNNITYNLSWDQTKQHHIAITPLVTYAFNLPTDNAILSILYFTNFTNR